MAAAPLSTTDRRRGAPSLEAARAALQRELDPRYVQFPSFAHQAPGSEPLVVPLGADDPLGDVVADPYAMVRSRATLHLTGRAVLVGPWGGEGAEPAACGLCLGLHWQRLRGGPEPDARAWGHGAPGDAERPDVPQDAVDVIRTVWSAVFDAPEPDDAPAADLPGVPAAAGEGPPRVTCVDLRVPVPRTYLLLPEPPCGLHTGCRG
jgi:ribosomal protein S12 methylthiotransferase accessory factor